MKRKSKLSRKNSTTMAKMANIYNVGRWETAAHEAKYKLTALCKLLEISARQIRRYTHKIFGMSPQEWLYDLRMRIAAGLLRKLPAVKQVYLALYFKQFGQFCRDFREYWGVTPGAFRDFCLQHEQAMCRYRRMCD